MDILPEQENLLVPVIPAGIGGKHVVLAPSICIIAECCNVAVRVINNRRRLDKDRISEHIHIIGKSESLQFGVVSTCTAFYYLAILIPHRTAVEKDGDTVPRVIIQKFRPQYIPVLVLQLHQRTPEFGKVAIDIVSEFVTCQNSLVLKNLDILDGIYFIGRNIPQSRIANEIRVIVQEPGRSGHLTVIQAVLFDELHRLGTEQTYKRIHLTAFFLGRQAEYS